MKLLVSKQDDALYLRLDDSKITRDGVGPAYYRFYPTFQWAGARPLLGLSAQVGRVPCLRFLRKRLLHSPRSTTLHISVLIEWPTKQL